MGDQRLENQQPLIRNRRFVAIRCSLFALLSLFAIRCSLVAAFAAEGSAGALKIGVVKVNKIFEQYERTKSSEGQIESLSKSRQAQRDDLVSKIKGMRDELVLLNEQARQEKQQAIEERLKELSSFDRDTKESLRKKRDDALKTIFDEIETTVQAYAKENGLTLIMNSEALLYGAEPLDVTDKIIAVLNERYAKGKR